MTCIGAEAVPEIKRLLGNDDPRVRIAALRTVQFAGPTAAFVLDSVVVQTRDADPEVRSAALRVWAQYDTAAALPAIVRAAREDSGLGRQWAIELLGQMHERASGAAPLLIEFLADPQARNTAITALGSIRGDPRIVVPPLIPLTRDPDRTVRYLAIDALSRVGPDAAPAVHCLSGILKDPELGSAAAAALSRIGAAPSLPALLDALPAAIESDRAELANDPKPRCWHSHTQAFIDAIQGVDSCAALPALLRLAGDQEPRMRFIAATGLQTSARACPLPFEVLEPAFQDSSPFIRNAYLGILGEARDASSAVRLSIRALGDSDKGVRETADMILRSQCPRSEECPAALLRLLAGTDTGLRAKAAALLGSLGPLRPDAADDPIDAALGFAMSDTTADVKANAEWALRARSERRREAERGR